MVWCSETVCDPSKTTQALSMANQTKVTSSDEKQASQPCVEGEWGVRLLPTGPPTSFLEVILEPTWQCRAQSVSRFQTTLQDHLLLHLMVCRDRNRNQKLEKMNRIEMDWTRTTIELFFDGWGKEPSSIPTGQMWDLSWDNFFLQGITSCNIIWVETRRWTWGSFAGSLFTYWTVSTTIARWHHFDKWLIRTQWNIPDIPELFSCRTRSRYPRAG